MEEERLLRAIVGLRNNIDFVYILAWLANTRAEYLRAWGDAKSDRLEHFQGRYKAIDDLLIYLGRAEQRLRDLQEKEKEGGK